MEERSCFNCLNRDITNLSQGRWEIKCKLGVKALNECIGGIKDNYKNKEDKINDQISKGLQRQMGDK